MSKLIEFSNLKGNTLRGIFDDASSDECIIFVHGFEGTTIDVKYRNFVEKLKGKVSLFRFDFTGLGMSDGDFSEMTVGAMVEDLTEAVDEIISQNQIKRISIICHSLGAVVALIYAKKHLSIINKIVMLAPALNQKDLQRYWYVIQSMKKKDQEIVVDWSNYKDYLDDDLFHEYCYTSQHRTSEHTMSNNYLLEVEESDYQILLTDDIANKIMIVHGQDDDDVPLESNNQLPENIEVVKIERGDHDLRSPECVGEYLDKSIKFLDLD